jgi:nanoRNase/pAp phosphatase (c-di-AMP/oligoRNAs hydrolase)
MVTTIAMTGGVFLLRKLMATAWTKVTGRVPPTDLTDPKVTLPEALAWAIATGIVVETARFAFLRSTMRKSLRDAEAESS